MSPIVLEEFKYDAAKGPVTLVFDFAATRLNNDDGEAVFDVGIECVQEQNSDGCAIPIDKSVMGVRTALMGESVAILNGNPEPVWFARVSHSYVLPPDSTVMVSLSPVMRENLDPKAIRLRLIYGNYDTSALPGQKTQSGTFWKIAATVLVLLIGFVWWMRRK